ELITVSGAHHQGGHRVAVYWLSAMREILVCGHDVPAFRTWPLARCIAGRLTGPGVSGRVIRPLFRGGLARPGWGDSGSGALRLAALGGCRAGAVSMRAYSVTTPGLIASGVVASLVVIVQLADRGVRTASRARTRGRTRDRCAAAAYL